MDEPEQSKLAVTPLQEWCRSNRVGPTELADLCGYSISYMSLLIRGHRQPPPAAKIKIARALGVRVRDLWPVQRRGGSDE